MPHQNYRGGQLTYLVKVGGELWAPEIKIEERADAEPCSTERESE
jgi:hypothetical protein